MLKKSFEKFGHRKDLYDILSIPTTLICLLVLVFGQPYFHPHDHCVDHPSPFHTLSQGDLIHSYGFMYILNIEDAHTSFFNLDLTLELRIQKHNYSFQVSTWSAYYTSDAQCQKLPSSLIL